MKDDRLNQLIDHYAQGLTPKSNSPEDQEYIELIRTLSQAGNLDLEPASPFIHSVEQKILKGGESHMANWISNLGSKPVVWLALGVVALFIASSTLKLPTPFGIMKTGDFGTTQSSVGEGAVGMAVPSQGIDSNMALEKGMAADRMMYPEPMPPIYPGPDDINNPNRSIVRSASLDLEVKEVSAAVAEATRHIESVNGMVTNSSVTKMDEGYIAYLTIRIPQSQFQSALAYFKGLAVEVVNEQISAYDQTGQVTETNTQIEDLQREVEQYQIRLAQAQNEEEKFKIQTQIDQLERQIKDWERQAQNLEGNEQMSTISLTFREDRFDVPFLKEIGLGDTVREAIQALKQMVVFLIVLAVWAVVFSPIWIPAWIIAKKMKKS